MISIAKTTALATLAAVAATVTFVPTATAQQSDPYIMLSEHAYFEGRQFSVYTTWGMCHNVYGDKNDIASAARWFNFPRDSRATVTFYDTNGCQGESRSWWIDGYDFPVNFVLDGFNDRVSSLRVTTTWGEKALRGSSDNATESIEAASTDSADGKAPSAITGGP